MNVRTAHTDTSLCFQWHNSAGHLVEISWLESREVWLRRVRPMTPDGLGAWTGPQTVELEQPFDDGDAEAIATRYAEGSP